ncbi:MAG: hypothetical protein J6D42_11705 [Clostridia bacterium]|nr:hypothetical protein [Clostridia bacterium]
MFFKEPPQWKRIDLVDPCFQDDTLTYILPLNDNNDCKILFHGEECIVKNINVQEVLNALEDYSSSIESKEDIIQAIEEFKQEEKEKKADGLTDNEIIKALECCKGADTGCWECKLSDSCKFTVQDIMQNALDLINRQKAEIERLRELIKEIYGLNGELEEVDKKLKNIYEIEDSLRAEKADVMYYKDQIKSEARKEFAKKLKNHKRKMSSSDWGGDFWDEAVLVSDIDNLVKEMERENDR